VAHHPEHEAASQQAGRGRAGGLAKKWTLQPPSIITPPAPVFYS